MPVIEQPSPLTLDRLEQVLRAHPQFNNPMIDLAAATVVLNRDVHDGRILTFNRLAGVAATLPAAIGSGARIRFVVKLLATSVSYKVQVANANDILQGVIFGARVDSGNAVLGFAANGTDHDTVTLNRTTTGSVSLGEWLEFQDIAVNKWHVTGMLTATGGAFATPFSSAV